MSLKTQKSLWKPALIALAVEGLVFSVGVGFAAFTYNQGGTLAQEAQVSLGNWTFNTDPWIDYYGKYGGYFTTGSATNYINQTDRATRWAGDHFVTATPTSSSRKNQLDVTDFVITTTNPVNIMSFPEYEQVKSGNTYVDRPCTQIYQVGGTSQNFFYNHTDASNVNTIIIPNTYTSVRQGAFKSTSTLTTAYFQDGGASAMTWGSNVFNNSAISSIHLPSSLTTVGSQAFSNCSNLATLDFSNTALTDTNTYFAANDAALTKVVMPSSLTTVGNNAFASCTLLSDITWSANLKTIGSNAFNGCSYNSSLPGLTNLDLSGTVVTSIGSKAFGGDDYLATVKLPGTLTSLGTGCLADGTYTNIDFGGTMAQFKAISGVTTFSLASLIGIGSHWLSSSCTTITCTDGVLEPSWGLFTGSFNQIS